jgi:hypothetical protein
VARFVKGDVVVLAFPCSDLSQAKRRPALVIAALEGNDLVLCQLTSKTTEDTYAIPIVCAEPALSRRNPERHTKKCRKTGPEYSVALWLRVGEESWRRISLETLLTSARGVLSFSTIAKGN